MKNYITLPLTLALAAIIIGGATIAINGGSPASTSSVAVTETQNDAVISILSVSNEDTAAVGALGSRVVKWVTTNYPANALVTINLIKKVSDNPTAYEFVRAIATDTANDGNESWTPSTEESGDAFYIEVVCSSAQIGTAGCRTDTAPVKAF